VTATNKDLPNWLQEGGFRKDLYYRINVVKLELPTLAQRKEEFRSCRAFHRPAQPSLRQQETSWG